MATVRAPDDEELVIKTGGKYLGGWTSVRVTRGVELLPSHFEVELTERFPGQISEVIVEPTATCEVSLSGDLVLTGYIDRYQPVYDKGQHRVRIIGRSKTEDLVDSALDFEKVGWMIRGETIGEVAKIVCDPFGITVSMPDGDVPIPKELEKTFDNYPGYTGYLLLEEMARSVGMLVYDNPKGELVIRKGGTGGRAGSSIVEGQNAERVEANLTADQRFARYAVFGQGRDKELGHRNYDAVAYDPEREKLRARIRVIPAEIPDVGFEHSKKRAQWEANRRWGRSKLVRVTVTGWRSGDGVLWTPNMMTAVDLPTAKIKEDRCVVETTWQRGERGTQTIMTLMPKEALSVEPFTAARPVPTG
jgi:prophage tail gpP-like protein